MRVGRRRRDGVYDELAQQNRRPAARRGGARGCRARTHCVLDWLCATSVAGERRARPSPCGQRSATPATKRRSSEPAAAPRRGMPRSQTASPRTRWSSTTSRARCAAIPARRSARQPSRSPSRATRRAATSSPRCSPGTTPRAGSRSRLHRHMRRRLARHGHDRHLRRRRRLRTVAAAAAGADTRRAGPGGDAGGGAERVDRHERQVTAAGKAAADGMLAALLAAEGATAAADGVAAYAAAAAWSSPCASAQGDAQRDPVGRLQTPCLLRCRAAGARCDAGAAAGAPARPGCDRLRRGCRAAGVLTICPYRRAGRRTASAVQPPVRHCARVERPFDGAGGVHGRHHPGPRARGAPGTGLGRGAPAAVDGGHRDPHGRSTAGACRGARGAGAGRGAAGPVGATRRQAPGARDARRRRGRRRGRGQGCRDVRRNDRGGRPPRAGHHRISSDSKPPQRPRPKES